MLSKTIPLRVFILKCLEDKERNGYGLMAYISKEFGWKPSPGTIYPLLKSMQKEGLIEFKKEKNKKTYRITPNGKWAYKETKRHHNEIAENMKRHIKAMNSILGIRDSFLTGVVHNVRNGELPFKKLNHEFMKVGEALLQAYKKGKIKDIKSILSETDRKLRRLK